MSIDTDPAKTYIIKVEGDKSQIIAFLDHAEAEGLDSYEIVDAPAGVDINSHECKEIPKNGCGCMQDPPCMGCNKPSEKYRGFYATIRYYDDKASMDVFICNSQQMENDATDDGHVFYYYDGTPEQFMKDYGADRGRGCSDWYAVAVEGVCPPAEEPNRLHLFKVYTIYSDLGESDPVFVMARTEDGAASLFHKARARDHGNRICEVIVDKVQDAEVCDE